MSALTAVSTPVRAPRVAAPDARARARDARRVSSGVPSRRVSRARSVVALAARDASPDAPAPSPLTRRETISSALAALALAALDPAPPAARAGDLPRVVVVGATGQTGALVVDELRRRGGCDLVAAVRSADKAKKLGVDAGGVTLVPNFDVTADPDVLARSLDGADALVVCTGFVPGNPFKMSAAARAVDNEGVVHLVDAAKLAGVKRVVLVSSILVDGRAMGAEDSPGFKITNAFGGVLDEKLVGEKHLMASGLEYCIVRPAGLRGEPPKTPLVLAPGNVMASGEVSRQLVAAVMAEAAFAPGAANKIVEIAEKGTFAPGYEPENVERFVVGDDKSKWF